jgi:hypothetical protein
MFDVSFFSADVEPARLCAGIRRGEHVPSDISAFCFFLIFPS